MIYFFDKEGRCIRKSTCVKNRNVRNPDIQMHLDSMADQGPIEYVISDNDYEMNEIYYSRGAIKMREVMPASISGSVITGIPIPSVIEIEGMRYDYDTDVVELEFTYPGVYFVKVSSWPYIDRYFKVVKS